MKLRELRPPADLPAADARVPAVCVRVAAALLGILLTLDVYGTSGWLGVGVVFSVAAAWAPEYLLSWPVIVFLALGQLSRPAGLSWQLLVLIAGVHLLHVCAMLTLALPWRSWMQLRAFRAPLLRFIAIQLPVQVLAVVLLPLLAPNARGHRPLTAGVFAVVGGAALAGLAALLLTRRSP